MQTVGCSTFILPVTTFFSLLLLLLLDLVDDLVQILLVRELLLLLQLPGRILLRLVLGLQGLLLLLLWLGLGHLLLWWVRCSSLRQPDRDEVNGKPRDGEVVQKPEDPADDVLWPLVEVDVQIVNDLLAIRACVLVVLYPLVEAFYMEFVVARLDLARYDQLVVADGADIV